MANTLFVSKSAILRLCKKINISGFKELKVKLAQEISVTKQDVDVNFPFNEEDDPIQIANKLHNLYEEALVDTLSLLDKQQLTTIASLIHSANVVDIYTHAHNLNVANNFQEQLLSIGNTLIVINLWRKPHGLP